MAVGTTVVVPTVMEIGTVALEAFVVALVAVTKLIPADTGGLK